MPALDQRYSRSVCDAIRRAKTGLLFGWVSSPDFVDEHGKRIVCKFDEADIESGRELIRNVGLYGEGCGGEHSDTCPSRGVRCEHGELCGGYRYLQVSFVPELVQVMSHDKRMKMVTRAVTKEDGSPKLDSHRHAIFENVPLLNEYKQPQWEWVDAGMVERWDAHRVPFSRSC